MIVNKLVAEKRTGTLEDFFDDIFSELMGNSGLYRAALEQGLIPPSSDQARKLAERTNMPEFKKRDKEPKSKETLQCNACGRTGHNHTKCNFVAAKHPDINPDFKLKFNEFSKGKAWIKQ